MPSHDAQTIVIGAGTIGSAAAYRLAEREQTDVPVVEQWQPGHGKGGSDDHSGIIRRSHQDVGWPGSHALPPTAGRDRRTSADGDGAGDAAMCSGLFGEVLADPVVRGRSPHPVGAFLADRRARVVPDIGETFPSRG